MPFIAVLCLSWWAPADSPLPLNMYKGVSDSAHTNVAGAAHSQVFPPAQRPAGPPPLPAFMGPSEPRSEAPSPRKTSLLAPRDCPWDLFSFLRKLLCPAMLCKPSGADLRDASMVPGFDTSRWQGQGLWPRWYLPGAPKRETLGFGPGQASREVSIATSCPRVDSRFSAANGDGSGGAAGWSFCWLCFYLDSHLCSGFTQTC